ncbi:MAG: hypothetical protein V3W06_03645, partial [Acidimicrobiia bacterium]
MRESHIVLAAVILIAGACSTSSEGSPFTTAPSTAPLPAQTTSEIAASPVDDLDRERRVAMVEDQIERRGISDPAVLEVMRTVPRHEFVPEDLVDRAYGDHPL